MLRMESFIQHIFYWVAKEIISNGNVSAEFKVSIEMNDKFCKNMKNALFHSTKESESKEEKSVHTLREHI